MECDHTIPAILTVIWGIIIGVGSFACGWLYARNKEGS